MTYQNQRLQHSLLVILVPITKHPGT